MSKKKFDNVVVTIKENTFYDFPLVNVLNSIFAVDYYSSVKELLLTHSLAIYFSLTILSIVLTVFANLLFFPLAIFGLIKMFDSYKFYLIKKDFEENGIF